MKEDIMENLPVFRKETVIRGFRIILHRLSNGINIEIIGGDAPEEGLNNLAKELASNFGGVVEIPDHPGSSGIRLVKIKREDKDIVQFSDEITEHYK